MSRIEPEPYRLPGDYERLRQMAFRAEMRSAFIVRSPTAFAVITGLTDDYVAPLNIGRLYTRHMRGIIEMERDQRRRAKGRR